MVEPGVSHAAGQLDEPSLTLLARAKAGDAEALNILMARYSARLQRWSTGRLPAQFRGLADTQDLVQDVLLQTLRHIGSFEAEGDWALQAYLRQAVQNRIRDVIRRSRCRPSTDELPENHPDDGPSPLESAIGRRRWESYLNALERLSPRDREAVIARVEMGMTSREIAQLLSQPSANAARMSVSRALVRLADAMNDAERRSDHHPR